METTLATLARDGFAVVPDALNHTEIAPLLDAAELLADRGHLESRGGYRDLFAAVPLVREIARQPSIRRWPSAVLGPGCFAVRGILFDKSATANWKVTWHQDLTIAVRKRLDCPGFGPWSVKAGIPHVQPPASVLDPMLTVRVHLDPCGLDNGPVRVLPGSHREGRLSVAAIEAWKARVTPVDTSCPAGGLLLMRPLVLHASSPATNPRHRRVIHLEYAAADLPGGLQWHERWGEPEASGDRRQL